MTDNTPQTTEAIQVGSALTPVLESQSLARPVELPEFLRPATKDDFRRELTSCLALCAPAGFDEAVRREWLTTAWATLKDVPADLLARGCRVARKYSDHPSKIVPQIMREIEAPLETRRQSHRVSMAARAASKPAEEAIDLVTPEQIEAIKAEFGLVTNPYPESKKPVGVAPRMPTRADYIAMGVDPAILDALPSKAA